MNKLPDKGLNSGYSTGLKTEVAIIGAGAAGLYTAYRLAADPTAGRESLDGSQVQVFEMSGRIGGRLWSVTLPGTEIAAELGGMRYMDQQMIASTLIETVFKSELKPIPFPMGSGSKLDIYLRKQRFKESAWVDAQKNNQKLVTNYKLNDCDAGLDADQLFDKIVYETLMADPWFSENYRDKVGPLGSHDYFFKLTARDWDLIKPKLIYNFPGPYKGRKVNDIGFWNLIKDRVSQEGYTFLADAGGYYSNTINWNAAEAFPYMVGDFSSGDATYKTIEGGYDKILLALAKAYLNEAGAEIWTENRLVGFARSGHPEFKYELHFLNTPTNASWTVYANRIVLAMPRRSLELLDAASLSLLSGTDPQSFESNLHSVIMEPSLKILMAFETPWWRKLGMISGHSVTDLPIRQCYYFGTDKADQHSILLGSYNDMDTVSFWEPLIADPVKFKSWPTKLVSVEALAAG